MLEMCPVAISIDGIGWCYIIQEITFHVQHYHWCFIYQLSSCHYS